MEYECIMSLLLFWNFIKNVGGTAYFTIYYCIHNFHYQLIELASFDVMTDQLLAVMFSIL